MPTTITSAGITFNDATSLTSATIPANAVGATQIANGAVTAAKLGTNEQKQIAKAWVNFNGTLSTPITPSSSYNVSSVTKNATGDYTVNFTTAMADANYSLSGMTNCYFGSSIGLAPENSATTVTAKTTSGFRVITRNYGTSATDMSDISISVFGN